MPRRSYPQVVSPRNSQPQETAKPVTPTPTAPYSEPERSEEWQAFCRIADAFATLSELSPYIPSEINRMIEEILLDYTTSSHWYMHTQTMRASLPFIFAHADDGLLGETPERHAVSDAELEIVRGVLIKQ